MCLKLNLMHSKRIEVVLGPSELRLFREKFVQPNKFFIFVVKNSSFQLYLSKHILMFLL